MTNPTPASHCEFSSLNSLIKLHENDLSHNGALNKRKFTLNLTPIRRSTYFLKTDFVKDHKNRDTQTYSYKITLKTYTAKLSQTLSKFKYLASLSLRIVRINNREVQLMSCQFKKPKVINSSITTH